MLQQSVPGQKAVHGPEIGLRFPAPQGICVSSAETISDVGRWGSSRTPYIPLQVDHSSDDLAPFSPTQVWAWQPPFGKYTPRYGDANRLPGGGTLSSFAFVSSVTEVSAGGKSVWELKFHPKKKMAGTTPCTLLCGLWLGVGLGLGLGFGAPRPRAPTTPCGVLYPYVKL